MADCTDCGLPLLPTQWRPINESDPRPVHPFPSDCIRLLRAQLEDTRVALRLGYPAA